MAFLFRSLVVVVLGLSGGSAWSQSSMASGSDVTIQFTVFSLSRVKGLCYFPAGTTEAMPLEFFTQSRSKQLVYRGPPLLRFYDDTALRELPPGGAPKSIARVWIPADMKRVLLVFSPVASPSGQDETYTIFLVDDNSAKLPAGHMRLINAAGPDLIGQTAERTFVVPRGLSQAVPAEGRVHLKLAQQIEDRWLRVATHLFTQPKNSRTWVVLFPPASPTGLCPQIRTLTEGLAEEQTEDTPPTNL